MNALFSSLLFLFLFFFSSSSYGEQCCFCIYQDLDPSTQKSEASVWAFKSECSNSKIKNGAWDWLVNGQKCTKVQTLPLSEVAKVKEAKSCESLTVAYVGHAKALHVDELLKTCKKNTPENCTGALCVKSTACGVPEDTQQLVEGNQELIKGVLKNFSKLTVEANQTTCTPSVNTFRTVIATRDQNKKFSSHIKHTSCFVPRSWCKVYAERFFYHGKIRQYRDYWMCLAPDQKLVQQTCCNADEEKTGYWSVPGKSCTGN